MNKFKVEATKMREDGYSYSMITEKLGVPDSTLSNWFKGKPFTPNREVLERVQYGPIRNGEIRHNQRMMETEALRTTGRQEIGLLTKRDLHILGLGLYIGEGSKSHEHTQIANANPAVIKLMVRWFKESCGLDLDNITISIHLYPDNDIEKSLAYWRAITDLPRENFRKTYIDIRTGKSGFKNHKLPYGTAYIRIKSNGDPEKGVRLHRKLQGWMDAVLPSVE